MQQHPKNMTPEQLDELIAAALASEPLRPAPLTLARRVDERLRVAAMIDSERARFRYSMAVTFVAFAGAVLTAVWFAALTNLQSMILHGVPGAMGTYDRYYNTLSQTWTDYSGVYTLTASMLLAGGTVVLGLLVPWGREKRPTH